MDNFFKRFNLIQVFCSLSLAFFSTGCGSPFTGGGGSTASPADSSQGSPSGDTAPTGDTNQPLANEGSIVIEDLNKSQSASSYYGVTEKIQFKMPSSGEYEIVLVTEPQGTLSLESGAVVAVDMPVDFSDSGGSAFLMYSSPDSSTSSLDELRIKIFQKKSEGEVTSKEIATVAMTINNSLHKCDLLGADPFDPNKLSPGFQKNGDGANNVKNVFDA